MKDIVHEYFKKEFEDFMILLQLNPVNYTGLELTIPKDGKLEKRKLDVDEDIYDDLEIDGFVKSSALEFNIYLKGLK